MQFHLAETTSSQGQPPGASWFNTQDVIESKCESEDAT